MVDRISVLRAHTFQLIAVVGKLHEEKRQWRELVLAAKETAKAMACELNMPEGLLECQVKKSLRYAQACRQLNMSVMTRLAKVFEALDHFEAHPYREHTEQAIREIINL